MSQTKSKPPKDDTKPVSIMIKFRRTVRECLHWLEAMIAFGAIAVVLVGGGQLLWIVLDLSCPENMQEFVQVFEELLSGLLLLIVGVEVALVLILRRPENLLEIMFFVIARKVLIKTHHVYELLIAVVAIGALFAIRKYLLVAKSKETDPAESTDSKEIGD
jgi:hypothetical protein